MPSVEDIVRFGPFEFDTKRQELSRSGVPIPLSATQVHVLSLLLEHPGECFTRDLISQHIRMRSSTVEAPVSVDITLNQLRGLLGDNDPTRPLYLEAVEPFGYRFIAPVASLPAEATPPPPSAREQTFPPAPTVFDAATLLNLQSDPFLRASVSAHPSPALVRLIGRRLLWVVLITLAGLTILYFVAISLFHHFATAKSF